MANESNSVSTEESRSAASVKIEHGSQMSGHQLSTHPEGRGEQQEGGAKGMLRDAIQKVMEEIRLHEKEAQKHMQQANALRRELRDSFAFMQEQKAKAKAAQAPEETGAGAAAGPRAERKAQDPAAAGPSQQRRVKKKHAGRQAKKA